MGAAFLEVLHDLWLFALGKTRRQLPYYQRAQIGSAVIQQSERLELAVPAIAPQMVEGRTAYVAVEETRCYRHPEISYDTVVGLLPYATPVKVDVIDDGFAHVYTQNMAGWIVTQHLTDDSRVITPQLRTAFVYTAGNEETIKLRRFIKDEFLGGELQLPLQPAEYAQYRVVSEMHTFAWPPVRPREPGRWQGILRGQPGIHMSVEPKTGSVLEYAGSEGRSFLAYVDSVKPDQSIVISSVGRLKDGEFLHEEVLPEKWREWRPVFIRFS